MPSGLESDARTTRLPTALRSPVAAVITFIHKVLVLYAPEAATIIESNDDQKPIFLTEDVNVNFASEEAKSLIEFLKRTLNLTMNTYSREGTRYGNHD
ncbi:hypothetical protein TNCV_3019211 [Trichonephila clavipes]|nr:hypothetical protein TNCV_3019211 [Trichonephila clavipes]